MTDLPAAAVTAALKVAPDGLFAAEIQRMLEAAAPAIRAQAIAETLARVEQGIADGAAEVIAQAAAAERQRIRQLAADVDAMYMRETASPPDYGVYEIETPFADLLREDTP